MIQFDLVRRGDRRKRKRENGRVAAFFGPFVQLKIYDEK